MRNIYLTSVGSHRFSSGISPQWAHMNQIILLYRISTASEISPEWDIPPHMKRLLEPRVEKGRGVSVTIMHV